MKQTNIIYDQVTCLYVQYICTTPNRMLCRVMGGSDIDMTMTGQMIISPSPLSTHHTNYTDNNH